MAKAKKKGRGGRKPIPKCKAFLLCERVIVEAETGNVSVISSFTGFLVQVFPGSIGPCTAFLQLVDGIGRYQVTVEIHDLRNNVIIAKSPTIDMEFPERPNRANLAIRIPQLALPHDGAYDVVVLAGEQEIERQQFTVNTLEASDGTESEQND
jgi:hypothetical protein